jgi:inner membrane protein
VDNITHGLAGLLIADTAVQWVAHRRHARGDRAAAFMPSSRVRGVASLLGIIAAEFPDSDLVYSGSVVDMGRLG